MVATDITRTIRTGPGRRRASCNMVPAIRVRGVAHGVSCEGLLVGDVWRGLGVRAISRRRVRDARVSCFGHLGETFALWDVSPCADSREEVDYEGEDVECEYVCDDCYKSALYS